MFWEMNISQYHKLVHKTELSKFKTEITSSIFSNHNTMSLEINWEKHKHVETKQYATKQLMDHWRNQGKNKKVSRDEGKQKHNDLKPMGHRKSSSKREVYTIQAYLRK